MGRDSESISHHSHTVQDQEKHGKYEVLFSFQGFCVCVCVFSFMDMYKQIYLLFFYLSRQQYNRITPPLQKDYSLFCSH